MSKVVRVHQWGGPEELRLEDEEVGGGPLGAGGAPQDRAHPGHQLPRGERLDEVDVRPQREAAQPRSSPRAWIRSRC